MGPTRLQNQLMVSFLERSIGTRCIAWGNHADSELLKRNKGKKQILALLDCRGKDAETCVQELNSRSEHTPFWDSLGLFNLRQSRRVEKATVEHGIAGYFYENDDIERLAKGVAAMLKGEMWFSRKTMKKYISHLDKSDTGKPSSRGKKTFLSSRETEILTLIVTGSKNAEIAEKLCISPHTVKTHIYNIFKKINASNRLQAVNWAQENL